MESHATDTQMYHVPPPPEQNFTKLFVARVETFYVQKKKRVETFLSYTKYIQYFIMINQNT